VASKPTHAAPVSIGTFLDSLWWLDGTRLNVLPYRRRYFEQFNARDPRGVPACNLGLAGRAKKNDKTLDGMLEATYCLFDESPQGSQVYIVANDEDQAGDDLDLLKKLFRANPKLHALVTIKRNVIERKDGRGFIEVLPANDAAGAHGKTYRLLVCDEIHGWRTWDLLEALALDPTRADAQQWITSYASLFHKPGVPLHDLVAIGKAKSDPRMVFSWYAADFTTDPEFAELDPESRANPSRSSWADPNYLEQQRRRLPSHKFRRLHLNLPGLPGGSPFQPEPVAAAIVRGVRQWPREPDVVYRGFVDMSGGSNDDATLAIARDMPDGTSRVVLVVNQGPPPPFDPRYAVAKFVDVLREYGIGTVTGDAYAGETFRRDFESFGISYKLSRRSASELYEALESKLNAGEVSFPDVPQVEQQLLGLIWKGNRITHAGGEHDDWINCCSGALLTQSNEGCLGGMLIATPTGQQWVGFGENNSTQSLTLQAMNVAKRRRAQLIHDEQFRDRCAWAAQAALENVKRGALVWCHRDEWPTVKQALEAHAATDDIGSGYARNEIGRLDYVHGNGPAVVPVSR